MALTKIDDRGLKTPIDLLDSEKIRFGTGNDLEIYHDGSNGNYIKSAVDDRDLFLQSTRDVYITTGDGSTGIHTFLYAADNAGVELRYDNAKKFETTSTGITVTGKINPTGNIHMPDNVGIKLGASDDLVLWHYNGDDKNYITSANARTLRIQADTGDETMAQFIPNGAVELYFDNSKKLETISGGITVTGGINTSLASTFATSTFSGNVKHGDGIKALFGTGDDLEIYHDGSNTYLNNTIGDVYLRQNGTENSAKFIKNGAVELYYDDAKKLYTHSGGVAVTGELAVSDSVTLADGDKIKFGHGYDLQIYHDGSNSYIDDTGTGSLILRSSRVSFNDTSGSEKARMTSAGDWCYGTSGDNQPGTSQRGIRIAGQTSGNPVLIATSSSHYTGGNYSHFVFYSDTNQCGAINVDDNTTTFETSSDYRLKENQVSISDGITRLKQLKPYKFNFKTKPDRTLDGFFAHEVQSVVPIAVSGTKDEMKSLYYEEGDTIPSGKNVGDFKEFSTTEINPQGIDQSKLVPLLTAALQEAITKIETLETEVAALKAK